MNIPHALTLCEWEQILKQPEIRESRGLSGDETPQEFAEMAYGVRFDSSSGSPGYIGHLYILSGDALGEPFTLIRKNGALVLV
jgi:hypothetical protein